MLVRTRSTTSSAGDHQAHRRSLKIGVRRDIIAALGDDVEPCATLAAIVRAR
jgi:hypothetical protein